MQTATIAYNDRTAGHVERLKELGYSPTVDEENGVINVPVNGIHTDPIDLTTEEGRETLQEVVSEKKGLGYNTRITFEDGTFFNRPALARLGKLSCLVVKKPKKARAPKTSAAVDALADSLGL